MKFLATLTAVVALAATPAFAAPSRNAESYTVINGNEEAVVFVPNSSEKVGTRATVWSGFFMHERIMDGLTGYDVIWLLNEYDCEKNTSRVLMSAVEDFEGNAGVKVVESTPAPVEAVKANTPNAVVLALACQRSGAQFIDAKALVEGFLVYRATPKAQFSR